MDQLIYLISPEGDSIALKLPDKNGKACEVVLTFDEASSLAMTLPKLLTMAFRQKYADETLRHVYPLQGYSLESASDARHLIVSLAAGDGFEVAFAITAETATALGRDLVNQGELVAQSQAPLPH